MMVNRVLESGEEVHQGWMIKKGIMASFFFMKFVGNHRFKEAKESLSKQKGMRSHSPVFRLLLDVVLLNIILIW